MAFKITILISALIATTLAQRSPYAGSHPIGYPEVIRPTTTTTTTTPNPNGNDLGNRFGEDQTTSTTTMRLPIEALGDKELVDRLSKLPIDQQPFWFINWQALEANRQKPHTYPQRPNGFVDPAASGFNFQQWV